MIDLRNYISRLGVLFPELVLENPWNITVKIHTLLTERIRNLGSGYEIASDVAVHQTASVDKHAIIKGPAIVGPRCFVGAHAYLRGGTFLDEYVSIGPGCEVKTSFIFANSALAHFNFLGDSLVGSRVNFEAGSISANHWNERSEKEIFVFANGKSVKTGVQKFGSLIGDDTKIGANAVLSPGTLLEKNTIVKRLQLIEQGG
jgi:bifunctional N-acetylglucosamine-1-phosphate-uridyltransferase/glucosamine-1-phosphate-acetyltransferase GlmU-like protein